MISVLIPVFNVDVRELVTNLSNQLKSINTTFEICVFDDGSSNVYQSINKDLAFYPNCVYKENNQNIGRLSTRQKLAQNALFPWLLFIDADCVIDNPQYIQRYYDLLKKDIDVAVGGTYYPKDKPSNCNLHLHWMYGRKRIATYIETTSNKKSFYSGFLFNNVLIKKDLFLSLSFPSMFEGYGHEDTWVGIQLEKKKASVFFISNPVLHPQLDNANVFLEKNINALRNLKYLVILEDGSLIKKHVKIYRYHQLLQKTKCTGLFNFMLQLLKRRIESNLNKCNPSLLSFDLLRLYYLNTMLDN